MLFTITSLAGYPIQILHSSLDATKDMENITYLAKPIALPVGHHYGLEVYRYHMVAMRL